MKSKTVYLVILYIKNNFKALESFISIQKCHISLKLFKNSLKII